MPETWMRTPFAVTIPAASRWKWLRRADEPGGDHAVDDGPLLAVHVGEELLERADPLLDARLDGEPFLLLDDARHRVERERPLLAGEVEGDALGEVARRQRIGAAAQLGLRHLGEGGVDLAVRLAGVGVVRVRRVGEHLVPGGSATTLAGRGAVALEQVRHNQSLVPPCCVVVSGRTAQT